jgi:hypothetical protein
MTSVKSSKGARILSALLQRTWAGLWVLHCIIAVLFVGVVLHELVANGIPRRQPPHLEQAELARLCDGARRLMHEKKLGLHEVSELRDFGGFDHPELKSVNVAPGRVEIDFKRTQSSSCVLVFPVEWEGPGTNQWVVAVREPYRILYTTNDNAR